MTSSVRSLFRKFGYDLQPYQTYNGRAFPERVWEEDREFLEIFQRVHSHTLLDRRRLYMLFQLARNTAGLSGHFAECGVYQGGSAMLLSQIKPPDKVLYLFDTFDGMPATDPTRDHHRAKDFSSTSLQRVQDLLFQYPGVAFRKGLFPESAVGLEETVFSFVHVDFDIYQSMWDACRFFYPRLVRGGCIIFDDYGSPSCPGAKQAVREFCSANRAHEVYLPTGQALLFNFQA